MTHAVAFVMTTVVKPVDAEKLANGAVEAGLAACVQAWPMLSIFSWQHKTNQRNEVALLFKTSPAKQNKLMQWVEQHHPFETPVIEAWQANLQPASAVQWLSQALAAVPASRAPVLVKATTPKRLPAPSNKSVRRSTKPAKKTAGKRR